MELSQSKSKKSAEYAAADEEIKCLAANTSGEVEKLDKSIRRQKDIQ